MTSLTPPTAPPPSVSAAPRVFISHASEDKHRFVVPFAGQLRAHGIDAWLDQWEMQPGDSLVDKIFTEGIGNAETIIIVVSHASINKPWVREEINAGFMQRMEGKARLLPIVLDDCAIPVVLKSTDYLRIQDVNNYAADLQVVIDTIFQQSPKPDLGNPPRYTQLAIDKLPGLTPVDTLVFRSAVEATLEAGLQAIGTAPWTRSLTDELDLRVEQIDDSLHILEDRHLLDIKREYAGHVLMFKVLPLSLDNYLRYFLADGDQLLLSIARAIVRDQQQQSRALAEHLGQPHRLILLALAVLEDRRYIVLSPLLSREEGVRIRSVTPLGRRFVMDQVS